CCNFIEYGLIFHGFPIRWFFGVHGVHDIIITQSCGFVKRKAQRLLPEFPIFTGYCGLQPFVKCCIMETEVFTSISRSQTVSNGETR
ncbi:MAG: hypothetical protein IKC21_00940, partial [Ruminococcus sp.]|nr:hypothetical protein [Ruminococcus sp.]